MEPVNLETACIRPVCRMIPILLCAGCAVFGSEPSPSGREIWVGGMPMTIASEEAPFPAVAGRLLHLFAADRFLEASPRDVRACLEERLSPAGRERWAGAMRAYRIAPFPFLPPALPDLADGATDGVTREDAARLVRWWMVCRELYDDHGGRVVTMDGMALPVDALRNFLHTRLAAGDVIFPSPEAGEAFRMAIDNLPDEPSVPADEAFTRIHTPWWDVSDDEEEAAWPSTGQEELADDTEPAEEADASWEVQDEERRQQEEIEEREAEEARIQEEMEQAEEDENEDEEVLEVF